MTFYQVIRNQIFGKDSWQAQKARELGLDKETVRKIESNYPGAYITDFSDESIVLGEELAQIVNTRRAIDQKQSSRLAYDTPDFLPFSFLGRGIRCGSSVCLIRRIYEGNELDDLINRIAESSYGTKELSQILNIDATFWEQDQPVKEALNDVNRGESLRSQLREKLKAVNPLPIGTGFLVGRDYLLTNHHILSDRSTVKQFFAEFRYEVDLLNNEVPTILYSLNPEVFITNSDLDYTLVSVIKPDKNPQGLAFREAGSNFGWLRLLENPSVIAPPIPSLTSERFGIKLIQLLIKWLQNLTHQTLLEVDGSTWAKTLRSDDLFLKTLDRQIKQKLQSTRFLGEPVNIIQHAKGGKKEIVIYNNRVQTLRNTFIQYETDAEPGASGSPLLNSQWQLVGIHHSALLKTETGQVVGYLGTRTCQIVKDLKTQANQLKAERGENDLEVIKIHDFLHQYVDYPVRGRIFISAGRSRNLGEALADKAEFETRVMKKLGKQVCEQINKTYDEHGFTAIHIQEEPGFNPLQNCKSLSNEPLDATICWLREQSYQAGDVAVELLLDAATPSSSNLESSQPNPVRGAKVYYIGNWVERKLHAELLLRELLKQVQQIDKNFPNQSAQPDTAVGTLLFCRKVPMPSLVLYVGYMTSDDDRKLLDNDENLVKIASGVARGAESWANVLSPVQIF
jgi:V8-like Glu-specific endopeptidase